MTEIDIAKVLIEGDTATIMGVKYKKVEESTMKIFDYETYCDYGKEWFLQILTYRKYALLDFALQWDDYSGEELFPRIDFHIGDVTLCGFSIRYRRFYFSCDIIGIKRNFEWYRSRSNYV